MKCSNEQVIARFMNGQAAMSYNGNLVSTGDRLVNYSTTIALHKGNDIIISNDKYY
jgi:hypothetical protein